jgi:plasmid maintenance system antidote protein VapI
MEIHIGSLIKELVKSKRIDIGEFAQQINCSRRNAYKIFDQSSINTEMLIKISAVIGQNLFFSYISDEELAAYRNSKKKAAELMIALKELSATMIWLNEDKKMKERVKTKTANSRK